MKHLYIIVLILCGLGHSLNAQQDAQYTQFMFNKMALNPGFAGNWEQTSVTALQRSQWVGFAGAPSTQSITINSSAFGKKVGAGLILNRDKVGATNSLNIGAAYAYKLQLSKGQLSIGLQASVKKHSVDWTELSPSESFDPLAAKEINSTLAPNFGFGVYYQQSKYYVGLSIPNINEYSLSSINQDNIATTSVQQRHYYLMAGGLLYSKDRFKVKMAGLVKYTANTPVDLDLHTSAIFFDKLWTGVTFRHGGFRANNNILESADMVVQYQFTDGLRVGLAYDISLSAISQYNSGTYEMMVFLQPFKDKDAVQNPRFF